MQSIPVLEEGMSPLPNGSSTEHRLDGTSSSHQEQKSGVLYHLKIPLAALSGFFSSDSLKTVSTLGLISQVPTEVVCLFFLQSSYIM